MLRAVAAARTKRQAGLWLSRSLASPHCRFFRTTLSNRAEANDKPYNGDPTREAAGQQAKVEQEIRRAIREKLASREAAEPAKTASLAPAYLEQLQPLEVTARPLPIAAKLKDSSKPDSTKPDPLSAVMGRLFDKEVHDDLSNALLSSLVQRSHMFLYSGDAWSEGYSVPLLKAIAAETGTHVMAIDLPDWSVMLSHIDPLFEDLTIVSHPYMPPPDLEPSARGLDGMPFFANFTRMVTVGDEDVDIVEPEEIENDADGEEEATAQAESMMNGIRAQLGSGKDVGASRDQPGSDSDESGDLTLSAEMMTNPLSPRATVRLNGALSDLLSTPHVVDGKERPRIIVIKHMGDLLNTRIGYTLFSRLVAEAAEHNQRASVPVVVIGLLHPSMFHPDVPPPGIPPFDVNPGAPVALKPRKDRGNSLGTTTISIVADPRLGGRSSVKDVMSQLARAQSSRAAEAAAQSSAIGSVDQEELPLFARVGIPFAASKVLQTPCNMQSPLRVEPPQGGDIVQVGSLRRAFVASQCLERNASIIRNICLLYRIPGFELNDVEAQCYRSMYPVGANVQVRADGGLVFPHWSLYSDPEQLQASKLQGRDVWTLDQRALSVMLHSLPDDVARRYFFTETFLHRWILLAQALAVQEGTGVEAIRKDPTLLSRVGGSAMLKSSHIRAAWVKMLESYIAMCKGLQTDGLPWSEGTGAADAAKTDEGKESADVSGQTHVFPLHQQLNFDETGVGRWPEDNMDVPSDEIDKERFPRAVKWTESARELKRATDLRAKRQEGTDAEERALAVPSPRQRIKAVTPKLTSYEKRLMGSVVDPQSMATGFGQVCVKEETVTTLQEIITLPLLRPEYFSRGVLKRHSVSGILLFGPPGTGKTMLAKAVARESGSVVLNIRGSDVYDKYFGEGEKLVEAVFSLARKLSPCVIFIDEVDALFSARSSGDTNQHRRDIMNQIMSEWDGLNSTRRRGTGQDVPQVMVMAATNRPFDLDDAILRRLPRRILVDLPTEADRAKILAIHLRGEDLDGDVDLAQLATRTQGFSGSDLKNVCVAAAQVVLRERVQAEVAGLPEKERGDTSLIEQLRRVPASEAQVVPLAMRHFDAALKKVAPSSSDQMESLVELRKWDKLFGDGAQERNRKLSIGFANAGS